MTAVAGTIGPLVPYLCFDASTTPGCGTAGSPLAGVPAIYSELETLEDLIFDPPGVTVTTREGGQLLDPVLFPLGVRLFLDPTPICTQTISVDADQGGVDGFGCGSSFGALGSAAVIDFFFHSSVLGGLPTTVGIVALARGLNSTVSFEAFDPFGQQIGPIITHTFFLSGFPEDVEDDAFLGASNEEGIARIRVSSPPASGQRPADK